MRTRPLITALVTSTLVAAGSALGSTAVTDPVGFTRLDLNSGSTLVSPSLVQDKVFQGVIATVGAPSTINVDGAPFTAGAFDASSGEPTHYVEVLSGANAGLVLDIVSNGVGAIVVDSDISGLGLTSTDLVTVRPHTTLGNMFHSATLQDFDATVTVFNLDGSSDLYFRSGSGWLATDFESANNRVIYPGQGVLLATGTTSEAVVVGAVKPGPTKLLVADSTIINLVSTLNPATGVTLADSNLSSVMSPFDAVVSIFSNDGTLTQTGTYFFDGASFLDASTFANADAIVIPANSSVVLARNSGGPALLSLPSVL